MNLSDVRLISLLETPFLLPFGSSNNYTNRSGLMCRRPMFFLLPFGSSFIEAMSRTLDVNTDVALSTPFWEFQRQQALRTLSAISASTFLLPFGSSIVEAFKKAGDVDHYALSTPFWEFHSVQGYLRVAWTT